MEPKITVNYAQLKTAVRQGLSLEAREYWWPLLPQINQQKFQMSNYPDIHGSAERLLAMTWSVSPMEALRRDNTTESNHHLLLETLRSAKTMGEYPILLEGFAQILLVTLSRFDVCHLICQDVMESKERKLTTTLKEYDCKLSIFRTLLNHYMPKTYEALNALKALDDQYLNLMFMDFFKTILPKATVLRLVDSYLLEGDKILFRYGFALIGGYKKFIKAKDFHTAADFWQTVQADARKLEVFNVFEKSRDHFFLAAVSDRSPRIKKQKSDKAAITDNGINLKNKNMMDYMTIDIHNVAFDKKRGAAQRAFKSYKITRSNIQSLSEAYYSKKRATPLEPLTPPYYPSIVYCEDINNNGNNNSINNINITKNNDNISLHNTLITRNSKAEISPLSRTSSSKSLRGRDMTPPPLRGLFDSASNSDKKSDKSIPARQESHRNIERLIGEQNSEREIAKRRSSVASGDRSDRGGRINGGGSEAAFAKRRSSMAYGDRTARMDDGGHESGFTKRRSSVTHGERSPRIDEGGNETTFAKRRSSVTHGERCPRIDEGENETAFAKRRNSVNRMTEHGGEKGSRRVSLHDENRSERRSECADDRSVDTRRSGSSPVPRKNSRKLTDSGNEEYRLQYSNVTVSEGLAKGSQVLTPHTAAQLFALCCPFIDYRQRLPLTFNEHFDHGLYPLFTTAAHGFFLASMYARTQEFSPLIILIKSVADRSRPQHIIGAYVTQPFKFPSFTVRGNGQSFLFRLTEEYDHSEETKDREKERSIRHDDPSRKTRATKFPWAENNQIRSSYDDQCRDLYRVNSDTAPRSSSYTSTGSGATLSQFAVFAPSFISFGASENYGTNAIRVDSELSTCHCGPSDTYGNTTCSVLGNQSEASFSIESVEVYGDKHSYDKLQQREREWSTKGKFSRRASATY